MIKRKILPILLMTILLSSCGNNSENIIDTPPNNVPSDEVLVENDSNDLLTTLKTNYASNTLNESYNSPIYNLEKDHIFEFDCSDKAGMVAYKAFKVFDNSNYENLNNSTYAKVKYNDGKITVSPSGVLYLNDTGSSNIDDGTWGALNKLYLVQYIDLETGEDLEKPIVTPFTIKHDIDAPTIKQGVDENNSYILSWDKVPGAVEYRVFEHFGNTGYSLECSTKNTSVSVEEFKTQQKSENYIDLINQDLINAGLDVSNDGIAYMNRGVKYTDDFDGYFIVIAIDANGNQSGISNIVNVRDIANRLPYKIAEPVYKKNIISIEDIPSFVNVEMVDGSIKEMLINYHGAQTYKYTDNPNKISIKANVENTLFNSFLIVLEGKSYDDVMSEISYVINRQDSINVSGGTKEANITIPNTPSSQETDDDIAVKESVPEEITNIPETEENTENIEIETQEPENTPTTNPNVVVTPDGYTTAELMYYNASEVSKRLENIDQEKLNKVLYANSELEAWIALNLITQMDIITVPTEIFPEAANTDYLCEIFLEAFRQNPTSGMVNDSGYSYPYESFVIEYSEDFNTRLRKTNEELNKAYNVANEITNDSMSDYEKIVAINNYFCKNASYDFDSMSTEVNLSEMNESYIDAHTPYGILVNNYGVCESYSEAFMLVGRMSGLEVLAEVGTLQGGGHEWNRVNVDGSWCILDVTNNDLEIGKNALLNVSEKQAESLLTPDKTAYMNYESYRATDTTKEYYYSNNICANSKEEAIEMLLKQLNSTKEAAVRLPLGTSENDAINILRSVIVEGKFNCTAANYMAGVVSISVE